MTINHGPSHCPVRTGVTGVMVGAGVTGVAGAGDRCYGRHLTSDLDAMLCPVIDEDVEFLCIELCLSVE